MEILNLTQHNATKEQKEAGVVDLPEDLRKELTKALTFEEIPDKKELTNRADKIYKIVTSYVLDIKLEEIDDSSYDDEIIDRAPKLGFMIGGAPYFMSTLEKELKYIGKVLYAFSKREVIEKEIDGKVIKQSVFKFEGFVEVA